MYGKCMANISNMFLALCWRLETSSRSFSDFIKMATCRDLAIFNSWHSPFIIIPYTPLHKSEILESWRNWLLSNWSRSLNWKGPGTYPQSSKLFKRLLPLLISISCLSLVTHWVVVERIYSKTHPFSCTDTHHNVTYLVNHVIVKKTKTLMPCNRNVTSLINEKINLCLTFWEVNNL